MLETIFEFAIALVVSPLIFCWAVDIKNAITHTQRQGTKTLKPAPQAPKPAVRYTSKPTVYRVEEGYPDKLLNLKDEVVTYKVTGGEPMFAHMDALGFGNKQLAELKAGELRKLGTRMGIRNAARGRKKDLLKQIRGKHGYA